MYKDFGKDKYLNFNWNMDRDLIDARSNISEEDWKEMEVLNWLHSTTEGVEGLDTLMAFFNELGRKFLLECKWQSCQTLLKKRFPMKLNNIQQLKLKSVEQKAKVAVNDQTSMFERKLIAFERERQQMIKLCQLLEMKTDFKNVLKSQQTTIQLHQICWDLIRS